MPSTIIGIVSGAAQIVYSGNVWSGQGANPVLSIKFKLAPNASGNIYLGLSGNMTMNSGDVFLSGGGLNDGYLLAPGGEYTVPKSSLPLSGSLTVFARHDAAASGQARLYWQAF